MVRFQANQHDVVGLGLGGVKITQGWRIDGMAFGFQNIQRKSDITRGQRRTIVEFRFLAQQKAIGILVGGNPHGAGDEAIKRIRFVAAAGHQRIEDGAHARGAIALQNVTLSVLKVVKFWLPRIELT